MTTELWTAITDNITMPLIVAIGAFILVLVKSFTDKISNSIVEKNKADAIKNMFSAKNYIVEQIKSIVQTAVESNMQLANDMKRASDDGYLTNDDIQTLQNSARNIIYNSLPANLKDPNDELYKLIGGEESLYTLVDSLIEANVYTLKNQCCK